MTDLRRRGASVVDRRIALGYTTRQDFAVATGLSYRLLGDVERGRREVSAGSWAVIEQALGWEPGTVRADEDRPPPVSAIRALGDAYLIAAELVERGDDALGLRLLRALADIEVLDC
ncbi:helix-turn-helix domain-containing protein [Agromyces tardus]|uniref:helix-turn-helix domain-containing protein n=1 Tax=Agromyces tardus TaxID=2583849 RepID=UPI003617A539